MSLEHSIGPSAGPLTTSRRRAVIAAVFCLVTALFGAVIFLSVLFPGRPFSRMFNTPGTDWMVYYEAVRAFLSGDQAQLYDPDRFALRVNQVFADRLYEPLLFHPWLYPPTYLLILLPFGALSFIASYVLFECLTFAALAGSLWSPGTANWRRSLALLGSPAACMTVLVGQNAFLSAALLIGGVRLLGRAPLPAGIALGMLSYKPQLWLLVPVALIAGRHWRALAVCLATGIALWLAIAALAPDTVRLWLDFVTGAALSAEFAAKWQSSLLFGYSPYVIALLLGAPGAVAGAAQLCSAALAVIAVAWSFRRIATETPRLAVLLAATVLFAPHVQTYDLVFLAVAVILVFADRLRSGFRPGEIAVLMLCWMAPYFFPVHAGEAGTVQLSGYLGMLTPLAALALILYVLIPTPARVGPIPTPGR